MAKLKVFIYFIVFAFATKAIAQPIDTVTIQLDFPFGYGETHCAAYKVTGGIASEFTLSDLDNYSFKWRGDSVAELDSLPTTVYNYKVDALYNIGLTVVEKATSRVINADTVVTIQTPSELTIPNVFTPNDDGENDLFKIFYDGTAVLEISIFTRTGTRVFNMEAPSIVWDGRNYSGAKTSPGVYYYVLTSESPNIDPQNGFIHIFYEKE